MQLFLSLANSEKGAPNENFARELLELFTLGVNNGYTERDVREAARALTGFTFDYESKRFGYDPERHDDGVKRIMGRVGRFTPLDVVDIAVGPPGPRRRSSATSSGATSARGPARPGCGASWPAPTVAPTPTCARCCGRSSPTSSSTRASPTRTWSSRRSSTWPGCCAPPGAGWTTRAGSGASTRWARCPFHPPNVSGWEGGTAWMSTSVHPGALRRRDGGALRRRSRTARSRPRETPEQAIASAVAATGVPRVGRAHRQRHAALRRAVGGGDAPTTWEVEHYFPERQRVLRHLLLAGPDAQVC